MVSRGKDRLLTLPYLVDVLASTACFVDLLPALQEAMQARGGMLQDQLERILPASGFDAYRDSEAATTETERLRTEVPA
jgi:hypothetical protein